MRRRLAELARSMLASGAATFTDLGVLALLASALHLGPRVASVPALLVAGVVNFVANRRFAFGVRGGDVKRHAMLFAMVQAVTIALNAIAFDLAMRALGPTPYYWVVRLVVSNVVYLAWSFPMFGKIFRAPRHAPDATSARSFFTPSAAPITTSVMPTSSTKSGSGL